MPHYPVLQDNGLMAVWSTVVDTFTALNCSDAECAAEIAKWHTGPSAQYVANTRAGNLYEFQDRWADRLGWAMYLHGMRDETVREAIVVSSDETLGQAAEKLRRIMLEIMLDIKSDEIARRNSRA